MPARRRDFSVHFHAFAHIYDGFGAFFAASSRLSVDSEGQGMTLFLLRSLQPLQAEIRALWSEAQMNFIGEGAVEVKLGLLHGPGVGWGAPRTGVRA